MTGQKRREQDGTGEKWRVDTRMYGTGKKAAPAACLEVRIDFSHLPFSNIQCLLQLRMLNQKEYWCMMWNLESEDLDLNPSSAFFLAMRVQVIYFISCI